MGTEGRLDKRGPTQGGGPRHVVVVLWGDAPMNAGDPAMLECAIKGLREAIEGVEIVVLSAEGAEPRLEGKVRHGAALDRYLLAPRNRGLKFLSRFPRVALIGRGSWLILNAYLYRLIGRTVALGREGEEFIQVLAGSDLLYNAGGGNLNGYWPRSELYPKCLSYLVAWALAKPIVLSGQTIGPLEGIAKRSLLRASLKRVRLIALRDGQQSANFLRGLGLRHPGMVVTADEAICLEAAPKGVIDKVVDLEGLPTIGIRIGVNLRNPADMGIGGRPKELRSLLAGTLDRIVQTTGAQVVLIPLDTAAGEDDRVFMDQVRNGMFRGDAVRMVGGEYAPAVIKGLISRMDAFIGMAYHSLLFGLSAGVPAVGLYTDEYYRMKNRGLFEMFGMDSLAVRLASQEDIVRVEEAVARVLREREELRRIALERTEKLVERARWPIELARRLILEDGQSVEVENGVMGTPTAAPTPDRGRAGTKCAR